MAEWIIRKWYIYIMEYYSVIKRNKLLIWVAWMIDHPQNYVKRKKTISKDYIFYDAIYMTFLKKQNYRQNTSVISRVSGSESLTIKGATWANWSGWVIEGFCILIMLVVSWIYAYVKIHRTICLKRVSFIVSKLYFNKLLVKRETKVL